MTIRRICTALVLALGVGGAMRTSAAQGTPPALADFEIDVVASDDAKLRATYYAPGKPGPGVILLHQCDMNRKAWTSLGLALAQRGVHVIAADYRGINDNHALPNDYSKRQSDIDAALATLASKPGVDKNRIAIGGASCGVDLAVQFARRTGSAKALIMLSGTTTDSGFAYIQSSNIPVFLAYSADEGGPLPGTKTGVEASKNSATTIRVFEHAGHGVPMFTSQPSLLPELADWVARILR